MPISFKLSNIVKLYWNIQRSENDNWMSVTGQSLLVPRLHPNNLITSWQQEKKYLFQIFLGEFFVDVATLALNHVKIVIQFREVQYLHILCII